MNEKTKLPTRKPNRLKYFDYSQNGAYFITICVKNKMKILWKTDYSDVDVEAGNMDAILSECGRIVQRSILNIPEHYPMVSVDKYVVMPNHVHLILMITDGPGGRPMAAPTISTVINQMKGHVSRQIGHTIWQKLFHDHVIRNRTDYEQIWNYIDTNPIKWSMDCFYV